MTCREAFAFIRKHGVVLASAKGPVPRLTEVIANEPIKGSWWGHPKGREIFRIFKAIEESDAVLVCRLVGGKVTFVHRRLWPALVRLANHFPASHLVQARQEHTAAGHHINRDIPFPKWVPPGIIDVARQLTEAEALAALGSWVPKATR